jgi:hypothetical protein
MHISKSFSFVAVAVVVLLCTVAVTLSPVVQAGNVTTTTPVAPYTAQANKVSTAAVKTPPVVGAG